jgi:catechol 2,3-dioxygenase-like lactoylglutathione lyase family enzyme
MLGSGALTAFVGVADLDRAGRFYGGTLGLPLRDESPYALVADAGGTMLRITAVERPVAAPYTVLGWGVADLDAAIDMLVSRGVIFARYDGMQQDGRGAWAAPSGARIAWFADPDGNVLSLTQFPAGG